MRIHRKICFGLVALIAAATAASSLAFAQQPPKPNILVIMGDDIGYWNISAYNRGMMGYRTPNIDRIANEGATFTDYYGQQSCTAGRAAFITGQSPLRTGLLKVGLPGAKEGLSEKDPTLAELLKPQGYVTGQFGKNHLGDRNDFLPTVHGFDEFFGNLYHLNAEDEPVGRPGSGKDDESKRQQLANASRIRKDPNMRPSNPSATLFTMTRYLSTGRSKEWPFQVTSWGHNCPTLSANALVSSPSVRSFT